MMAVWISISLMDLRNITTLVAQLLVRKDTLVVALSWVHQSVVT
jgi:hypothetical protein